MTTVASVERTAVDFLIGDFRTAWNAVAATPGRVSRGNFMFGRQATLLLEHSSKSASTVAVADNLLIVPGQRVSEFVIGENNATSVWEYKKRQAHYKLDAYTLGLDTEFAPALQFQLGSGGELNGVLVQSADYATAGGLLFRSLLHARLVDTVEVAIMPVLLGKGIPLLPPPAKQAKLKLTGHKVYKTGIVALEYSVV